MRVSVYGVPLKHKSIKKISDEEVRLIRKMKGTDKEIADRFGVAKCTINFIRNYKSRKAVK
jgi:hypothetical protein